MAEIEGVEIGGFRCSLRNVPIPDAIFRRVMPNFKLVTTCAPEYIGALKPTIL